MVCKSRIKILKRLTSYTIQFITGSSNSDTTPIDWTLLKSTEPMVGLSGVGALCDFGSRGSKGTGNILNISAHSDAPFLEPLQNLNLGQIKIRYMPEPCLTWVDKSKLRLSADIFVPGTLPYFRINN